MRSIRFNTFETNSSSCHSVTICKKSMYDSLMNKNLFYVGSFQYSCDGETYFNNIDNTKVLTFAELKDFIISKCQSILANNSKHLKNDAQWIIDHIDELTPELIHNYQSEEWDDWSIHIEDIAEIHDPLLMFGEDTETDIENDMEYELADGDKIIIRLIDINC